MDDPLHNSPKQEKEQENPSGPSRVTLALVAIVLLVMGTSLWFLLKPTPTPPSGTLPVMVIPKMGDAELEYAKTVRVENMALSRAENFLHQEVTILNAEIVNGGTQAIAVLELSVEFSDEMNQVVLRETRNVLGTPPFALAPGERRSLEISFDHLPASWNMQQPAVHVTSLRLAKPK